MSSVYWVPARKPYLKVQNQTTIRKIEIDNSLIQPFQLFIFCRRIICHNRLLPIRQFKILFGSTPGQIHQPVERIRWHAFWKQNFRNWYAARKVKEKTILISYCNLRLLLLHSSMIWQAHRLLTILMSIPYLTQWIAHPKIARNSHVSLNRNTKDNEQPNWRIDFQKKQMTMFLQNRTQPSA